MPVFGGVNKDTPELFAGGQWMIQKCSVARVYLLLVLQHQNFLRRQFPFSVNRFKGQHISQSGNRRMNIFCFVRPSTQPTLAFGSEGGACVHHSYPPFTDEEVLQHAANMVANLKLDRCLLTLPSNHLFFFFFFCMVCLHPHPLRVWRVAALRSHVTPPPVTPL